jgi:hypothetical protein
MNQELSTAVTSYRTAVGAAHMLLLTEAMLLHMHGFDAGQVLYAQGLDRHDAVLDKLELHKIYPDALSRHTAAVNAASAYTTAAVKVSSG